MQKWGIKIDWFVFAIRTIAAFVIFTAILGLIFSVTKVEFPDVYFVKNYSIAWLAFYFLILIILIGKFLSTKFVDRKLQEYKDSADRSGTVIMLNRLVDQSAGIYVALTVASLCYSIAFPK